MQIRWTKTARKNLEQLELYVAKDKPKNAIDMVLKILSVIELLEQNPALGKAGRIFGTRELVITGTPYIVAYRVKNNCFEVLRVLHGAMQWEKCFR